jgi:hypothetical protein
MSGIVALATSNTYTIGLPQAHKTSPRLCCLNAYHLSFGSKATGGFRELPPIDEMTATDAFSDGTLGLLSFVGSNKAARVH